MASLVGKLKTCSGLSCNSLRVFCRLNSSSDIPPLNIPISQNVENPITSKFVNTKSNNLKITTLPNGVKIASEDCFGQFCTVGALIDAGSRYEIEYDSGISHMLEKIAFHSTKKYESNDSITKEFERLGGHADCQIFRDCSIYAASAFKFNVEGVVDLLSQAILHPKFTQQEVEDTKQTISFELESFDYRPDLEPQLTDLVHSAAFHNNTLGLPKLCPESNLAKLDAAVLHNYIQRYYHPERITISGVNVDHEQLVEACRKHFNTPLDWPVANVQPPDRSLAQYTGGIATEHRAEPRLQPGITQLPELVHIAMGFESANYADKDMFSFAVLNTLMGGGGSFSAGGPGKGMYSRLYTNVLNRRHWMFSSTAYNHSYADGGLFCIHSSAHPDAAADVVKVISQEFRRLVTEPFEKVELARAKKQTQSMLMMNLESRVVIFEDIGRQILGLGFHKSPKELYESIEAVTSEDLKRISDKMFSSKISVAAMGNLNKLPQFEDIQQGLFKRSLTSRLFSRS